MLYNMRIYARTAAALTIGALAVSLAGCVTINPSATPDATPSQEPAPTSTVEAEPSETPTEEPDLANRVEEALLANLGVDEFYKAGIDGRNSPLYSVTEIEDVSSTTVRVHVQETLTDTQRDEIGRQVHTLTVGSVDELGTVVVRDATGVDSNHRK